MKKRSLFIVVGIGLLFLGMPSGGSAAVGFDHLDPGGPADLSEDVPVNFVFVGYEPGDIDVSEFLAELPEGSDPVVRSRLWYGVVEELGLHYTYDYSTHFTSAGWEDDFFSALGDLADPQPPTLFQQQYNDQVNNVLDVTDNNWIDAPSVEEWLVEHAPAGVDTTEDTVFFVNWWGRSDFVHHVYTKTDEPDPDTGFNFGEVRESRKIIAWGGTTADDEESGLGSTHRVWFYDLSAGPESWTDNWNVDNPDLDGNGIEEYRMPPIWEYDAAGYRSPSALTGDLGKIARYVALDMLFTSSPLYPPAITPEDLPQSVNVDSNTYEGLRGTRGSRDFLKSALLQSELGELQPLNEFSVDKESLSFSGSARRCYLDWLKDKRCFPKRPYPAFANLFLYNALNLEDLIDGGGADYEAGVFNYSTEEKNAAAFLGFADDNYIDGTQSLVFGFLSPGIIDLGYGLTTTLIHEVGHHVAMSHPHDGYDSESGTDFDALDDFYFAWSGDENNSIMSYIDLNWDFSQFDLDNMARFMAAAYTTNANAIAEDILASRRASRAADELAEADDEMGDAQDALADHDYQAAAAHAKAAYDLVVEGAREARVRVEGSDIGTTVLPDDKHHNHDDKEYATVDQLKGSHRARR